MGAQVSGYQLQPAFFVQLNNGFQLGQFTGMLQ